MAKRSNSTEARWQALQQRTSSDKLRRKIDYLNGRKDLTEEEIKSALEVLGDKILYDPTATPPFCRK